MIDLQLPYKSIYSIVIDKRSVQSIVKDIFTSDSTHIMKLMYPSRESC